MTKEQRQEYVRCELEMDSFLKRLVRLLSAWAWKQAIKLPTKLTYERGLMTSRALHEADAYAVTIIEEASK